VDRKLSESKLLPLNTTEDWDGLTVNESVGGVLHATPSSGTWGMKMLALEKHGKERNSLGKLAEEAKLAICAGGAGKEREVWEFRA